uniref:Uncharacterized protein n=1 Tax=Lutzomyia longipalpis TaxID=7200 RepID=A0A1B0CRJ2_LUTLO
MSEESFITVAGAPEPSTAKNTAIRKYKKVNKGLVFNMAAEIATSIDCSTKISELKFSVTSLTLFHTSQASQASSLTNEEHLHSSNNHETGDFSSLSTRLQDAVDFAANGTIRPSANSTEDQVHENEELLKLMTDLNNIKKELFCEQQRNSEMEEQLISIIQENQTLQGRLANSNANEEMKSIHDELSILEEVRQGQMCSRCLRMVDDKNLQQDEDDGLMGVDHEDDDQSLLNLINAQKVEHSYRPPPTKESCSICEHLTKYLHELPVSLISLLLELWLHFRSLAFIRWILKIVQWPALLIYRMIGFPNYDDFNFSM